MDGTFKIVYKEHAYSKSYLFRYSIILMSIIDGAHYRHTYTYPFILSLLAQLLSAFSSIFWVIFSVKDPKFHGTISSKKLIEVMLIIV